MHKNRYSPLTGSLTDLRYLLTLLTENTSWN